MSHAPERTFYLRDGDRVVFYGDSITDQRLYTTFVESYAVTRFANLECTFVHCGWEADQVSGGRGRHQALRVHKLTLARNHVYFARWRQLQVPLENNASPELSKAIEALRDLEDKLVRQQREAARPRPRRYELAPLG